MGPNANQFRGSQRASFRSIARKRKLGGINYSMY